MSTHLTDHKYYINALKDINNSFGVSHDTESGQSYELAIVNPDAPAEEGFDLEYATEKSSLSNNPGNAPEFAANAAIRPGRKRVYVASPGNGLSSDFTEAEHKYIRKTGRCTDANGNPLPTFVGLVQALEAAGLRLDAGVRLSANSAGGIFAKGLMAALNPNTVTHAYFKNSPGITDHPARLAWAIWDVIQEGRDDSKSAKLSTDPWRLTDGVVNHAKQMLPNIYGPASGNIQQTKAQQARTSHAFGKLLTSAALLTRGPGDDTHPAAADTAAAMRQQQKALVTNHFSLHDRLYGSRADMEDFLRQTQARLGRLTFSQSSRLELLITSGTHRDHTNYPGLRWAAENRAFNGEA